MKNNYSDRVTNAVNLFFVVELLQHAQQTIRSDLLAHIWDGDETNMTGHLLKAHSYIDDAIKTLYKKVK